LQIQHAALDELGNDDIREQLAHREHGKHVVGAHRLVRVAIREPVAAAIDRRAVAKDQDGLARDAMALRIASQLVIERSLQRARLAARATRRGQRDEQDNCDKPSLNLRRKLSYSGSELNQRHVGFSGGMSETSAWKVQLLSSRRRPLAGIRRAASFRARLRRSVTSSPPRLRSSSRAQFSM
jgi:hypothetical protein